MIKEERKEVDARGTRHGYRCLIVYVCALADLTVQSRAQARLHLRHRHRHRPRLARVPAEAVAARTCHDAADEACTAAATVPQVERELGSTAQGRRYFAGEAGPESFVS
jgi:hypothetical protein